MAKETKDFKVKAIEALVDGATTWFMENGVVTYADKSKAPTDEQITAKSKELKDAWVAIQYQRDRAKTYPSIQDQLDMQYHDTVNGTTTWKDAITKVKSDVPKPS